MHQLRIDKEKQKWRDILTRILRCIKYLATQILALRGRRESLQEKYDDSNVGNFLGVIKLLNVFYGDILWKYSNNVRILL